MHQLLSVVIAGSVALGGSAPLLSAQQPADPAGAARAAQEIADAARRAEQEDLRRMVRGIRPVQVEVIISRHKGEKKIASVPYTLSVNTNDGTGARLRMGAEVPLPIMQAPVVDGKPLTGVPATGPVEYKAIGTNIDCEVTGPFEGRYKLGLVIEESSIVAVDPPEAGTVSGPPVLRSFRLSNSAILRDGETTQFSTATDRLTGEVTKIDVSLRVLK